MDTTSFQENGAESGGGVGETVGILIVVVLFVIGGLYFFITQELKFKTMPPVPGEQVNS